MSTSTVDLSTRNLLDKLLEEGEEVSNPGELENQPNTLSKLKQQIEQQQSKVDEMKDSQKTNTEKLEILDSIFGNTITKGNNIINDINYNILNLQDVSGRHETDITYLSENVDENYYDIIDLQDVSGRHENRLGILDLSNQEKTIKLNLLDASYNNLNNNIIDLDEKVNENYNDITDLSENVDKNYENINKNVNDIKDLQDFSGRHETYINKLNNDVYENFNDIIDLSGRHKRDITRLDENINDIKDLKDVSGRHEKDIAENKSKLNIFDDYKTANDANYSGLYTDVNNMKILQNKSKDRLDVHDLSYSSLKEDSEFKHKEQIQKISENKEYIEKVEKDSQDKDKIHDSKLEEHKSKLNEHENRIISVTEESGKNTEDIKNIIIKRNSDKIKKFATDTGKDVISKKKEKEQEQQEVINKLKEEVKELQLKNTDPKISNHIIKQNEINSHMIRAFASLIEDNKLNSKIRRSGFGMFF